MVEFFGSPVPRAADGPLTDPHTEGCVPAYLLGTVREVTDRHGMEAYWLRAGATLEGFGGKPLAVTLTSNFSIAAPECRMPHIKATQRS
jgi:hypothetical protein